ncbi:MAG: amidase [Proteobacteria bacterium]|nr:amidase [Pseudomonadota bacterium]
MSQLGGSKTVKPQMRPYLSCVTAFRDGSDSPSAYLERCLATIEAKESDIAAFVSLDIAGAREAALQSSKRWQAGDPSSPIDGMPIGVKDIMETAALPTGEGSPLFEGRNTRRDAAVVAALRSAGAIVLGKTVTTEFAAVSPGPTRNPWDPSRTPGGSSSGSAAAVACGMIPVGLGTQVIGSTIRPASFCGCYGFKPSVHALNRGGSFDYKSHSVTTVLAASLDELWIVGRQMALRCGGDYGHVGLQGPLTVPPAVTPKAVILLETAGWTAASPEAKAEIEKLVANLWDVGVRVHTRRTHADVAAVEDALATASDLAASINIWEDQWPLNTYARDLDESKISDIMRKRLRSAATMTQEKYGECLIERERVRSIYEMLSSIGAVCLTLSASGPAPVGFPTGDPTFAIPASILGIPAISLPGMHVDGLPVGLQLMGFKGKDSALFAHAASIARILSNLQD